MTWELGPNDEKEGSLRACERERPVGRGSSQHTGPEVGVCLSCEAGEVERPEHAELSPGFISNIRRKVSEHHCDPGEMHSLLWASVPFCEMGEGDSGIPVVHGHLSRVNPLFTPNFTMHNSTQVHKFKS